MPEVPDPEDSDIEALLALATPRSELNKSDVDSARTVSTARGSSVNSVVVLKYFDVAVQDDVAANKTCVGGFGSFFAQFSDGMCISTSAYGAGGEPENGKNLAVIDVSFQTYAF